MPKRIAMRITDTRRPGAQNLHPNFRRTHLRQTLSGLLFISPGLSVSWFSPLGPWYTVPT